MESTIPIASVAAKPLTVPEPLQNRTAAAIRVVTFPSMIAESALAKPALIAILDGCSQTDLLFDTGENDNVRIHRHTNRQDDTSHARKRQSHLKCN